MPSLGTSFGRGAATMSLWDLENADCVLIMGSNMAENHPIAFRFVVEAKRRGATIMHVDPRFTRTSALADIHAAVRSGSDIAFLGGIIRHILENDLWFREFALAYTNLAHIIEDGYANPDDNDGVFSGFDPETGVYDTKTWQYKGKTVPSSVSEHRGKSEEQAGGSFESMADGPPPTDLTLQHPNCVYQIMRRHYARYTPEMVESITGCPQDTFLKVADALAKASGRERTAAICYAVGWTHHTVGVQIIRAAAIIQTLLGNVGRPGGGIMALRGHASIQGSTDIPTLYNMLPTYLPQPNAFHHHAQPGRVPPDGDAGDRLVAQHAEIRRQPAEGLVRRGSAGRQRILLRALAEADRGPVPAADDDGHGGRRREGPVHPRPEPARRGGQRRPGGARAGAARFPRGARFRHDGVGRVLAQRPPGAARGREPGDDRHRGVLPADDARR